MSKIRVSEIFRSIQGEGDMTGRLSIWIRFFGCNLKCPGFYQADPTDPSTFKKTKVDWKTIQKMADLPVFEYGCDSEYSWHPNYKKLVTEYPSAKELVAELDQFLYDTCSEQGRSWHHPITQNSIDLCFTGGEPMLQQKAIVEIMNEINVEDKYVQVQIETNGTKKVDKVLKDYVFNHGRSNLHFNISPKLYHVSGEKDAVNYDNIYDYQQLANDSGILKFVINNDDRAWQELNRHVMMLRAHEVMLPIYVMPCGATKEQQENSSVVADIAKRAIDNGYHVSGRVHAIIFGNIMGT